MNELINTKYPVVLFDGVCNLCSTSVQFIISHDRKKQFRFASLQSEIGQKVLKHFNLPSNDLNSFVLLQDGKIYTKSTAALLLAKKFNGLWKLFYVFMIVPRFIRDAVYKFIAHNRYRWF